MNLYQNNIENYLIVNEVSYLIAEPEKFDQVKIILMRDEWHGFNTEFIEDEIKLEFTYVKTTF